MSVIHAPNPTTPEEVAELSYVDLISLLRETNRCPGGKQTIREVLVNAFAGPRSDVLEIGSNTGFTSLEIARTARCRVVGIDPNANAVEEARRTLAEDTPTVRECVRFEVGSAYELPFADTSFDLVIAGGATSFMDRKECALNEYHRVLRPWGFLSTTHLCYMSPPPADVVDRVSRILGVRIQPWTAPEWLTFFERNAPFERYYVRSQFLGAQSFETVKAHAELYLEKPHLKSLPDEVKRAILFRWTDILLTFNENHRYLGFLIALHRKRALWEEPELFLPNGSGADGASV